jgi:hypothetical protein
MVVTAMEDAEHLQEVEHQRVWGLAYHDGRTSPRKDLEVSSAEEDVLKVPMAQEEPLAHQVS